MAVQDRKKHGKALRVHAEGKPPRRGQVRGVDERLNLNEKRASALLRHQHARPGNVGLVFGEEDGRRVRHAAKTVIRHGEDAELVHGAEAVLEGAHETEVRVLVALEIEHRIDDVLENSRTGKRAVLGDVTDEDEGRTHGLGHARESCGALAHLRNGTRRAVKQA